MHSQKNIVELLAETTFVEQNEVLADTPLSEALEALVSREENIIPVDKPKQTRVRKVRQRISSKGDGENGYVFSYRQGYGRVYKNANGWQLDLFGIVGRKTYKTKAEALNYAADLLDTGWKPKQNQPEAEARPSYSAPWRSEKMTKRQVWAMRKLRKQVSTDVVPYKRCRNRGEASDYIDALKKALGKTNTANDPEGCSIGPFRNGFCTCCGLKQNTR